MLRLLEDYKGTFNSNLEEQLFNVRVKKKLERVILLIGTMVGLKQELARKLLKVPDNKGGRIPADEEDWNSHVLFEVKSGKQVDPIATRFYNAESQSPRVQ